jgi:hypothetical protein
MSPRIFCGFAICGLCPKYILHEIKENCELAKTTFLVAVSIPGSLVGATNSTTGRRPRPAVYCMLSYQQVLERKIKKGINSKICNWQKR